MFKQKSASLADQVFEYLQHDILNGVYPRGSILTELELCEKLGVSRTPIREAIRRLEQEHILEATGKGMKVLSVTQEDAEAIFKIRTHLERLAVEDCVDHITEEEIQKMQELLEKQEFYAGKNNSEQVRMSDGDFHRAIYNACSSRVYYDTLNPLLNKTQSVRKNLAEYPKRSVDSIAEHYAILEAIRARDKKTAGEAMEKHIRNARNFMEDNLHV